MSRHFPIHENEYAGGKSVLYYKEQCDQLAEIVRDLAKRQATGLISKKLGITRQAVWTRFPVTKEANI